MGRIQLSVALLGSCFLASCQLATGIEVFNNTEFRIRIAADQDRLRVESHESRLIYDWQMRRFTVEINDSHFSYELRAPIPESFTFLTGRSGRERPRARFQLESDGRVWLLGLINRFPLGASHLSRLDFR